MPKDFQFSLLENGLDFLISALDYLTPLEAQLAEISAADGRDYAVASGGGREVLTMDRDETCTSVLDMKRRRSPTSRHAALARGVVGCHHHQIVDVGVQKANKLNRALFPLRSQ